jgi:hypothetical protein
VSGPRVRRIFLTVGAVLLLIGAVWALQGVGLIPGSFMTGRILWLVIGSIVAVAGLGCVLWGLSGRSGEL